MLVCIILPMLIDKYRQSTCETFLYQPAHTLMSRQECAVAIRYPYTDDVKHIANGA